MIHAFRSLLPYVRPYRGVFLFGLLGVVLSKVPQMALPKVLQLSVDHLESGTMPGGIAGVVEWLGWASPGIRQALLLYGGLYLGLSAIYGLLIFAGRWYVISTSRRIEYDLRNRLFDKLATLSTRYYQRSQSGDVISRTTNDMDAVRSMIGPAVMYSVNSAVAFSFALTLMLSISWELTLISLLPFPVLALMVRFAGKMIHDRFLLIQEKLGGLSARIQENLSGIRVVKSYAQEPAEISRFADLNDDFVAANQRLIRIQAAFFPAMMFLAGCATIIALLHGGHQVVAGAISLGRLVQFVAYLGMLIWPAIAAGWVVNMFQRGAAAFGRISEVMDEVPDIADGPETDVSATVSGGAISIQNLTFGYEPDVPVLHDIRVDVAAGESLGIVGPTGCGKSTLAQLMVRVLDPPDGTAFIDGTDVRRIPLEGVRGAIGMVPQESFLFSDTIFENVRFGQRYASESEVSRVAEIASLTEEIEGFAGGWQTLVGERGITLSGGQKQRVAIARALLKDAPILILDDALSAVDTRTEAAILDSLGDEMARRTTIIVAHRLSAVKSATHIIYLEDGRIMEEGTHDQLVALDGHYADLYRRQLLEEELEAA